MFKSCAVFPQYFECPVTDPVNCSGRTRCGWYKKSLRLSLKKIDESFVSDPVTSRKVFMYYSMGRIDRVSYGRLSTSTTDDVLDKTITRIRTNIKYDHTK